MVTYLASETEPLHLQAVLAQDGSLPAGQTRTCFQYHSESREEKKPFKNHILIALILPSEGKVLGPQCSWSACQ